MSVNRSTGVYLHSPLARAVYIKMIEDANEPDHSQWYSFRTDLVAAEISSKFVLMTEDDQTKEFLHCAKEKSDWLFTQLFHSIVKFFLSWVMNNTSINGLLQRGSMFVFSQSQFQLLMNVDASWTADRLLDLGAGDGAVTRQMASHFNEVYVTEISSTMVWRLRELNYRVLGIDEWASADDRQYDVVSCLNLLDRCERPLTLLQQIRAVLKPVTGRLLLAVVLPFSPYVEAGDSSHQPRQQMNVTGSTFEEQISSLVRDVLNPSGFEVERFTRLPYLCEGDLYHSYYVLHDAVFILRIISS